MPGMYIYCLFFSFICVFARERRVTAAYTWKMRKERQVYTNEKKEAAHIFMYTDTYIYAYILTAENCRH